jgi:hypothetical protein
MDYYFLLCASGSAIPASNNILRNCVCERRPDPTNGSTPAHWGHGFLIQAYEGSNEMATNNTIEDCVINSLAEPFLLRGRGASGKFRRCISDYKATISNPEAGGGRITIYSSKDNVFSRIYLKNAKTAVLLGGLEIDSLPSYYASENNVFENCIFDGCERGIELSWYDSDQVEDDKNNPTPNQSVVQTHFRNCTFAADTDENIVTKFFWSNRNCVPNNTIVNCIIKDFDNYVAGTPSSTDWQQFIATDDPPEPPEPNKVYVPAGDWRDGKYTKYIYYPSPGFIFINCCFWPTAFASGPGNKTANPAFATSGLYELSSGSQCIEAGTGGFSFDFPGDYDGTARLDGDDYDIGAQEGSH